MTQSSGRLQELQRQLALLCDIYAKNDEDYRQQILQSEQEQEKNRKEIEQLCISKHRQEMKTYDEYPEKKRDLEVRIIAERDAKVAELVQECNEIFTRELADMASRLSSEKAQDEETIRSASEAFNAEAAKSQAQIQALQATRFYQKAHEDDELLLLQQEIQVEQENQRRHDEIKDRRRAIEKKKQEVEKMIQETKEEEEILRQLQQEKTVDVVDTVTFGQSIEADDTSDEQSGGDSIEKQRGASPIPPTTHSQTQDVGQTQRQTTRDSVHKDLTEDAHNSLQISIGEKLGQQFDDEQKLLSTLNEAISYHGRFPTASDQDPSFLHYLQGRLSSSCQCHEIEKRHWRRLLSELCKRHEIDVFYILESPFPEIDDEAWADLASSASAGSLWVSLYEIFEPFLGSHARVVIAAYSGDLSNVESLEGSAKEAFLYEIKSRSQNILRALYAAIPAYKEFLKVIALKDDSYPFAIPSSPSSGSQNALSEPDEHWLDDAASISESSETRIELLTVDLEAEKIMMDARWKVFNGEYTAPWWMKGVPIEKITEEEPYWDKQWTKSRDVECKKVHLTSTAKNVLSN